MSDFPIIIHKYGTAAQWTTANPILEIGEIGVETDTHMIKVGDGTKTWSLLPYVGGSPVPATQRQNLEIFNFQTADTVGNDRVPYSGKIYVADPNIVGATGSKIDGASAGDIWLW